MFSKNWCLFWFVYCVFTTVFNFVAGVLPYNSFWWVNFVSMNASCCFAIYFAFRYYEELMAEKQVAETDNSFNSF